MTPTAVGILRESFFCGATCPVRLLCCRSLISREWVDIERAELLAAFPAPGFSTPGSHLERPTRLEPTGKDVVACGVLQSPALAPWTLLRITRHSALEGVKILNDFTIGCIY